MIAAYSFVIAPITSGVAIVGLRLALPPTITDWLVIAAVLSLGSECWFGFHVLALEIQSGPLKKSADKANRERDAIDRSGTTSWSPGRLNGEGGMSARPTDTQPSASHTRGRAGSVTLLSGANSIVAELRDHCPDKAGCCLLSPESVNGTLMLEIAALRCQVRVVDCTAFGTHWAVQVQLINLDEQMLLQSALSLLLGPARVPQAGSS